MKEKQALELLRNSCMKLFGCTLEEATKQQIYKALCTTVREIMYDRRREFKKSYQGDGRKQVYYMSMEFLVGTSLHNNLYNLGMEKEFTQALQTLGIDIHALYEMEQVWATAVWDGWPPAIWTA